MKKYYLLLLIAICASACKKETAAVFVDQTGVKGTTSDIDGNSYTTIGIGGQIWMVENLKTTKYNDGTGIANVTDTSTWRTITTGAQCVINNVTNTDSINKYGRLYNWEAVNTGKLCPKGWHVPSNDDWITLEKYLIANGYNFNGSPNGNYVAKSLASATGWDSSTTVGSVGKPDDSTMRNKTGFTALPTGFRDDLGKQYSVGQAGYWWSSTALAGTETYYYWCLLYTSTSLINTVGLQNNGLSVRCVKN